MSNEPSLTTSSMGSDGIRLVVGLGMSGIGAVQSLDEAGQNWFAVEAQHIPGGWSQSNNVSHYRLDFGPHIMLDFDESLLQWMDLNEEIELRQHSSRSVFFCEVEGRSVPVHLPLSDNIDALPNMSANDVPKTGKSNYVSHLIETFGPNVAMRFLVPYDRKRLCVDLETLPPRWNPRVQPARKAKVGEASYLYPVDVGVGALSKCLLKRLDQNRLRFGTKLVGLSLRRKRAYLSDGSSVRYATLYSSLPLPELLNLLEECPFDPDEIKHALPYSSSELTYLAVREKWAQDYDFARIASQKIAFHRLTVLSAYSDRCCPTDETLLMVETNHAPGMGMKSTANPRQTLNQLIELGMLSSDAQLTFSDTAHVEHSAIYMNSETSDFVARVRSVLADSDVHLVGKFGRWEDLLMGGALKSGMNAVQKRLLHKQNKESAL
ncbi:hypothetical protein GCM10007385_12800 [Tateyamaria omphalii]|uniref:NAD(P)/FAD-dependent oxidoreductase n=1 Tax=Tateyamaria omphalii TaxID=299262 RepID=UPI00167C31A7|nr:NAD(P)/FAD-dependent oxidoreductase [Tateyamaria omphalii]GGX46645.1 hypothetical protein GCM10007385_12800 [Tateyamaria omphalii]